MKHSHSIVLTGFLVFLTVLCGCASIQSKPADKNYFELKAVLPEAGADNIFIGAPLYVKTFPVNSSFDSHSFVYRIGKNEYVTDYYNEFINPPSRIITENIAEYLYHSSRFTPAPTDRKQDITYLLSGSVTRLYGDFQTVNAPTAVIEIRMTLEKNTGKTFQIIAGKTYLAEEPILSRNPDQLVSGWNKGLVKIMTQFIRDL